MSGKGGRLAAHAALAAVLAGCAGSNTKGLSKEEFTARANAICAETRTRIVSVPAPPLSKTALGEWPAYLTRVLPIHEERVRKIRALRPPESARVKVEAMLGQMEKLVEIGRLHAKAASEQDLQAFETRGAEAGGPQREASKLARQSGLVDCVGDLGELVIDEPPAGFTLLVEGPFTLENYVELFSKLKGGAQGVADAQAEVATLTDAGLTGGYFRQWTSIRRNQVLNAEVLGFRDEAGARAGHRRLEELTSPVIVEEKPFAVPGIDGASGRSVTVRTQDQTFTAHEISFVVGPRVFFVILSDDNNGEVLDLAKQQYARATGREQQ